MNRAFRALPYLALLSAVWIGTGPLAEPARVGVVDVDIALQTSPRYRERLKAVERWSLQMQTQLNEASEDHNQRMLDLDQLDADSPQFRDVADEIDTMRYRLERRRRRLDEELDERKAQALTDTFLDILRASEQVRQREGLDLMLQSRNDVFDARTVEEVTTRFVTFGVLARNQSLDMTQKVVAELAADEGGP